MIHRSNRFHGRAAIQRVYSGGQSVRSGSMVLRYTPNPRRQSYRLAVVVSRKVSKSAVTRNRIRRRIYECVRILSSSLVSPCDLVILVYDDRVATLPPAELDAQLQQLLRRAQLFAA